jgi:hypothetical protein
MVSLCGGGPFGRGALPLDGRLLAGAPDAAARQRLAVAHLSSLRGV